MLASSSVVVIGGVDHEQQGELGAEATACEVVVREQAQPEAFGLYVWPCSIALAEYVWHHRAEFRGLAVLELGAGTAIPSVVAGKLGCRSVTITDAEHNHEVLANCRELCRLNAIE